MRIRPFLHLRINIKNADDTLINAEKVIENCEIYINKIKNGIEYPLISTIASSKEYLNKIIVSIEFIIFEAT